MANKDPMGLVSSESLGLTKERPDSRWASVKAEDINEGFEAIEDVNSLFKSADEERHDEEQIFGNPSRFVKGVGHSRFMKVSYRLVSLRSKPPKVKQSKATNAHVVVKARDRTRFAAKLKTHIDQNGAFFLDELLPRAESLMTSIRDTEEKFSQLTNVKADIPARFIVRKATLAVYLRLNRHLATLFDLTDRELEIMNDEFLRRPNHAEDNPGRPVKGKAQD